MGRGGLRLRPFRDADGPVYPTLNALQIRQILLDCGARWIFCSTNDQLSKVLEHWPELPELEAAVLIAGDPKPHGNHTVLKWKELTNVGASLETRRPEVRTWPAQRKPSDLLTIIYTSGTTGTRRAPC